VADNELRIEDGMVVSLDYTLRADDAQGEVLDSSEGSEPLQYMHGYGQVIPGLERELYGLTVGDARTVTVAPEDGYGVEDPDAFTEVPRDAFPSDVEPEPGMPIGIRDDQGQVFEAYVAEVRPDSVLLDFNHPLAGQTLHFDVKVVDLRPATEEEQEHGHVHGEGHSHEE
jgi:FKBP-type peptidyl-prolyl cis-trans isomerase SlyD